MHRDDNLTVFMCRLSSILVASTARKHLGLCRTLQVALFLSLGQSQLNLEIKTSRIRSRVTNEYTQVVGSCDFFC